MDEIVEVIADEVGKPPMDALVGDVLVTLEQLRYDEQHANEVLRKKRRGKSQLFYAGTSFFEVREPHGVVLVYAPWNYPLQLSVVPMATALIAGNAVLLKCSERSPRIARLIEELCIGSGLPESLVQVSCEPPDEAAALLECRPDFVFFTGSSRNGRNVAARAADLMIPAAMELGGKDAALVFDSCDLERTASGVAYGSFSNAGQVCAGTKRIYVQQGIYGDFLRVFLKRVAALRIGKTMESDLGPVCFDAVRQRLSDQVEDAVARGAKLHTPWRSDKDMTVPVVLTDVPKDAALLVEESFGPVVCVSSFASESDAIDKANGSLFALTASVWTGDKAQGERVALRLHCGSCSINDAIRSIGNPEAAFGGNKMSGYGRYHGVEGLRTFSRLKTVMAVNSRRRTEIHWFPFQARTFALLRGLLRFRHGSGLRRWKALWQIWMILLFLGPASLTVALTPCCKP
jgi:acyl-CoA reductase-like NAD-dependent aldehyde dehydrogenase